jgi:ATP-binding cassette subfamily B protein
MKGHPQKLVFSLRYIPQILRLVWQTHPYYTLALIVLTIAQGLWPTASVWIGKLIIDGVVRAINSQDAGQDVSQVFYLVGIELGLTVLGMLLSHGQRTVEEIFGELLSNRVQMLVLNKATTLDLSFYEDSVFYDKLQRAQLGAGHRPLALLSQSIRLLQSTVSLSSLLILLVNFNWLTVLVLFLATVPNLFVQWRYAEAGFFLMYRQTPKVRKLSYWNHLLTSLTSFKEIKLFGLSDYFLTRYAGLFDKLFRQHRKLIIRRNISSLTLTVLGTFGFYGFYFYAIRQTILQLITLGDLTLYSRAFSQSQGLLQTIVGNVKGIYEQSLFIGTLFEFLALEPRIKATSTGTPAPICIASGIEFRDVSFHYPGNDRVVLKNINIQVKPNQTVALVGENGAGKTTLVKLLCRFYDPCKGEVLIDGVNIKEYDIESLHKRIGVIFQDYTQYQLSARENIGLGKVEALYDDKRIKTAAHKSGVDEIIESLPHGYETILGRLFENSSQLSIGEWQKIALARAFMRDTPILILDEPAASLDARTEYEIFQRFSQIAAGRITFLISHRFSTVRAADHILVLNGGRIVEQGGHEELMRMNGLYAQLFNMQAEKYW